MIGWVNALRRTRYKKKQVISETFFPANLFVKIEDTKPNTTTQTTREQNSPS